ncbi:MAG: histidine kinase [Bacteroidota bacterium]|nr:histidine kinase [Bacteroidota bacterium]MDP4227169.1 histidine kinase [Bacteroidota bacterium]MDP4274361.1 histidine kinase [Bacteroidota bacterium]
MKEENWILRTSRKPQVFWLAVALFYFIFYSQVSFYRAMTTSILYTVSQYVISQVNLLNLLPKFFDSKRKKYIFSVSLLLVFVVTIAVSIEKILFPLIFSHIQISQRPWPIAIFQHSLINLIALVVSIAFYVLKKEEENKNKIKELSRQRVETELKFLKSQINPHFLFNALNNIYTISYIGDPSTPEKILMLSDMLRYVLYDCKSDFVRLRNEVDYIRNFIEFQQMKTEQKQNISFTENIEDENYKIAPMLLIPLIENSFKHSLVEKDPNGYVQLDIEQHGERLRFHIANSIPSEPPVKWLNSSNGIGLNNVKMRLDLIYPDNYSFKINNNDKEFKLELQIGHGQ